MAFDLGAVVAHIKADLTGFNEGIASAKKSVNTLGDNVGRVTSNLKDFANQATLFTGVVAGAAGIFGKQSVDAYNESAKAIAQTNAVLKSTGQIAGVTAEQVTHLATSLQKSTTFSDEAVRSSENLLLTFTNIGKNIFPDATKAVLDMSVALGQDTKSSAIQLGKALQDPILGVTALRRVGVNFNEKQRDVIKNLVETGHSLEAQKMILKELSTEFGGSASAQAETYAGKIEILKNRFNDFQERIGAAISGLAQFALTGDLTGEFLRSIGLEEDSPLMLGLVTLRKNFIALGEWIAAHRDLVITFLQGVAIGVSALLVIGTLNALLVALLNPLTLVVAGIAALYTAWQTNFLGMRDITIAIITEVVAFFNEYLMPAIAGVAAFVSANWTTIVDLTKWAWEMIKGLVFLNFGWIYDFIKIILKLIAGDWQGAWDAIIQLVRDAWGSIKAVLLGGLNIIRDIGGLIFNALKKPFEDAWGAIQGLMNKIRDALDFTKRHSPSVVDIVQRGVSLVNRAFEDLPTGIPNINGSMGIASTGVTNGGINSISLNINLDGAIISDDIGAQRISERIGNNIIQKLQQNLRF